MEYFAFIIEQIICEIRRMLKERVGDTEFNLTDNPYGFKVVWLEDDEVYWEYHNPNERLQMAEMTELAALLDSINATIGELENED